MIINKLHGIPNLGAALDRRAVWRIASLWPMLLAQAPSFFFAEVLCNSWRQTILSHHGNKSKLEPSMGYLACLTMIVFLLPGRVFYVRCVCRYVHFQKNIPLPSNFDKAANLDAPLPLPAPWCPPHQIVEKRRKVAQIFSLPLDVVGHKLAFK